MRKEKIIFKLRCIDWIAEILWLRPLVIFQFTFKNIKVTKAWKSVRTEKQRAILMHERCIFISRSIDCWSEIYRLSPCSICKFSAYINVQSTEAAGPVAGEIKFVPIRRKAT